MKLSDLIHRDLDGSTERTSAGDGRESEEVRRAYSPPRIACHGSLASFIRVDPAGAPFDAGFLGSTPGT